ncbi:hypothetical protein ACGTJS_10055 [Faucicola mancuniensis]|uniref:hypothetical protein n=1 Tax=Faucicola mancuniensis TaxID=1309795 RepID=UPI003977DEDD
MTNPTVLILNQLFRLNSIPSIDMLPLDRFIALTTEPFSDSCPLKIRQDLSEDTLDKIPFFRLCESLLLTLQREEKIKLTTTGAFFTVYTTKSLHTTETTKIKLIFF